MLNETIKTTETTAKRNVADMLKSRKDEFLSNFDDIIRLTMHDPIMAQILGTPAEIEEGKAEAVAEGEAMEARAAKLDEMSRYHVGYDWGARNIVMWWEDNDHYCMVVVHDEDVLDAERALHWRISDADASTYFVRDKGC